ncbi:MAG: hypothetical protein KGR98_01035 [Verrucomicrobia bacterium]|nr:hypothetical protein [Verrucomicrobiota bacterium]MDE3098402.1 hypothetical protein [Verrucomicrobiota bacterium]
MKTKKEMYLLAVGAAVFSLSIAAGFGQVFNATDALQNRAIAASPRAQEEFPWLRRQASNGGASCCKAQTQAEAAGVKNRALAMSPRMLEQFSELNRQAQSSGESPREPVPPALLQNRAIAASPRMIEQYPWLATHAVEKTVEVAPIK